MDMRETSARAQTQVLRSGYVGEEFEEVEFDDGFAGGS
jgi:hypothetical protein